MKFIKDSHFWIVLLTVLIATIPQLYSYLPKAVTDIALVLLGASLLVINRYQGRQAYLDGVSGRVGSRYR